MVASTPAAFMPGRAESTAIKKEAMSTGTKLTTSRHKPPTVEHSEKGTPTILDSTQTSSVKFTPQKGTPLPLGDARTESLVAENSRYAQLKQELFTWETLHAEVAPSRERAFYSALRGMLQEILRSGTTQLRNEKLAAAQTWFVKNQPVKASSGKDITPSPYNRSMSASPSATRIKSFTNFGHRSDFFSVYSRDNASPLIKAKDSLRAMSATPTASTPIESESSAPSAVDTGPTPGIGGPTPAPTPAVPGSSRGMRKTKNHKKPPPEWKDDPWARKADGEGWDSDDSMERLNDVADEEAGTHELLRMRWRASETQAGHWQVDIQDAVMEWSLNRARIEEEIVRRQEATRYASPYPHLVADDGQSSAKYDFTTPEPTAGMFRAPTPEGGDPDGENGTLVSNDRPIWLSPYASADGSTPLPNHQRGRRPVSAEPGTPGLKQQLDDMEAVASCFERNGRPLESEILERALMVPIDKPHDACVVRLPQPGAHLLETRHISGRRKKPKPGDPRKKKLGSPKKVVDPFAA